MKNNKENKNNGYRNSSTRSEAGKQEINNLTEAEKFRKEQIEFLRRKGHKDPLGRTVAKDSRPLQQRNERLGDIRQAELDAPQDKGRKARKSLPVLSHGRILDEAVSRSRSGRDENFHRPRSEEQETLRVQGQVRRALMNREERKIRRAAFRVLGGIWTNHNGRTM